MKRSLIFGFVVNLLINLASGQTFTSSNLPIVVIDTDNGVEIPDEPKVAGTMKIIYRGPGIRNYLTDQNNASFLNYNGRIKIEIRGSSSQAMPKKQYGFTTLEADLVTNNNVSLLGMPEENDWILNGMVFDPALMRDYLSYNLSRQIGQYASRTVYCEVVINGIYKGLYILQEKIKADDNRVNVHKIEIWDNTSPDVTGGYITKADKTTGGDPVAWTMLSWFGSSVAYIHDMPKPENVTTEQNDYIHSQFLKLEATAFNGDASVSFGFPSVIDIPSFIDYMIINELGSNADAYTYSAYFHKDRNGKLRAGPVWDMDLTYGNDLFLWGYDRSKTDVWQFSTGDNDGSRFWKDLFSNSVFRCYLTKRWNELIQPGQPLNQTSINQFIDQTVNLTAEAVARDYAAWDTDNNYVQQISGIKSFTNARVRWITDFLGSYSECSNVPVPPVVINRINYHPSSSFEFPESEDLEFIELFNDSNQSVDMTGLYFGGTGFVYQFPVGAVMSPHSSVYLASNISAFRAKYGFTPYGKFTRHLSNKGEDLVLVDAFGNIVDNVTYSDTIPWPDADGNGNYLILKDPSYDNSLAESWIATADLIVTERTIMAETRLLLYPNPVSGILNIQSESEILSFKLFDIYGHELISMPVGGNSSFLDMTSFPKGVYIMRIAFNDGSVTKKIIKE